ncbi:hypothetical protein EVAR_17683_1 [Eumeta japonica]|uniref:Mos1 transposase HTH domain-containing protein n=1 Tax=Eumeta variegata TaxID=151549 RepID=A0A4C1URR2_EUMVA|nr:hypothetical protein EVAR_17683_1 [Eumeta japonica]
MRHVNAVAVLAIETICHSCRPAICAVPSPPRARRNTASHGMHKTLAPTSPEGARPLTEHQRSAWAEHDAEPAALFNGSESSNLSNIEHRAVIKYFVKKGKTPKEIFEDIVSVLQESAPSYTMVKKWARSFQQERESCEDDPRPGRLVTVVTEENVRKIEN